MARKLLWRVKFNQTADDLGIVAGILTREAARKIAGVLAMIYNLVAEPESYYPDESSEECSLPLIAHAKNAAAKRRPRGPTESPPAESPSRPTEVVSLQLTVLLPLGRV